eukprot:4793273-Pyramimonas_sp.AAC.1
MFQDIKGAAARVGLELHPDKTKILSNATRGTGRPKEPKVMIGDIGIDIAPDSGSMKHLGRMVGFDRPHEVETNNRIRCSWKCSMQHRAKLTDRSYPLNASLRLFDSSVTDTVLCQCGSATWVLMRELED